MSGAAGSFGQLFWLYLLLACTTLLAALFAFLFRRARRQPAPAELDLAEQTRLAQAVASRTEELHRATARAEEASRAKSAFLSVISHELRTPLHTIIGYTQLLKKRAPDDFTDQLAIIERSGEQLLHLIDQVLDYSRGEAQPVTLQPEPVRLTALAAHLGNAGRLMAEKNANLFSVQLDSALPVAVEADEQRLSQVLLNLIGNACKYTEHGMVQLRIGLAEGRDPAPWRRLRFEVSDSGIGIPAEKQAHIFEPFSRVAGGQRQPGVGLGLAIARQLVHAMDSEIGLDSSPSLGSRFFFELKLRETHMEDEPLPSLIGKYSGEVRTLLVADDIKENRELMQHLLSLWGFRVEMAADGAEAIDIWRRADPPIDAALVDQIMPDIDGWGFLRAVRKQEGGARLPVILISAALPQRPADYPENLTFDRVIIKPVNSETLADHLQQLLGIEWSRERKAGNTTLPQHNFTPPPAENLAEFRAMLELGQIPAIRRWADDMALARPECGGFSRQVKKLCQTVDLEGLRQLLEQAEKST